MKKGSLIRQLAIMLTAQILLLIVVLLLVIAYTIHNARVEKEKMLSNLLTVYGQNLENRIQRADGILENITLNCLNPCGLPPPMMTRWKFCWWRKTGITVH